MDKWSKRVSIPWLSGTTTWLEAHPTPPRSVFKLQASRFKASSSQATVQRYDVVYDGKDMCDVWKNVWLVARPGTLQLPAVHGLPTWAPGTADDAWHEALDPIADDLRAGADLPRLEGFMPVLDDQGMPRCDHVQMVYLDKAVTNSDGTIDDLVLVTLSYVDGGQEDGAGSGPPK